MSTKYTFCLKEESEKEKKLKDLEALLLNAKAKSRFKTLQGTHEDIFEFVPDGATLKKNGYCRSYQILRINEIKKSTADPLKKLSDLVEATACNHDVFFERWPSLSSRLKKYFRFEDGTYSAVVDLILDMAEEDVENGIERTVEQWYNTILLVLNGMKVAAEKKTQIEVKVDYEEALANSEAQCEKFEKLVKEATYKQRDREVEIVRLQRENSELQKTVTQLQHDKELLEKEISQLRSQLEANSKIVSEAKKSIAANRTPIADETLTVLADGVKEYVDEVGVDKAYDLFNRLNTILIDVPAWTKHASALKKVFKKARKEMQNRSMVQGDLVVNKHVDKEVNGVSAGATGILISKDED